MKAYTHEVDHREVILDMNIRSVGFSRPSDLPSHVLTGVARVSVTKVTWTSTRR